mmetsp:Transcript_26772/g.28814  ORF Transcript_26772/g.28814 Transcript_26772/m.28814 type:complete len:98 (-) Transcript_26772:7-300(-)
MLSQTHIKLNPPVTNACVKEHQFTLYLLFDNLCIIANNTALTIAIYLDDCDQFGALVTSSKVRIADNKYALVSPSLRIEISKVGRRVMAKRLQIFFA